MNRMNTQRQIKIEALTEKIKGYMELLELDDIDGLTRLQADFPPALYDYTTKLFTFPNPQGIKESVIFRQLLVLLFAWGYTTPQSITDYILNTLKIKYLTKKT